MKHLIKVFVILAAIFFISGFITSCAKQTDTPGHSGSSSSQGTEGTREASYYYETGLVAESRYTPVAKNGTGSQSPRSFNELKQIKDNLAMLPRYGGQKGNYTRNQLQESLRSAGYGPDTINETFSTLDTRGNIIVIIYRTKVGTEDRLTYMYIEKQ